GRRRVGGNARLAAHRRQKPGQRRVARIKVQHDVSKNNGPSRLTTERRKGSRRRSIQDWRNQGSRLHFHSGVGNRHWIRRPCRPIHVPKTSKQPSAKSGTIRSHPRENLTWGSRFGLDRRPLGICWSYRPSEGGTTRAYQYPRWIIRRARPSDCWSTDGLGRKP